LSRTGLGGDTNFAIAPLAFTHLLQMRKPVAKRSPRVIVLPSRSDSFPNACLEAMVRGKLVEGTRGASFEQWIDDRESGLLCEIDDRQSLQSTIERALTHPDPGAIGERAKARIET
jgi:glycosyltransferase involved in cell wall biosynthesis